MVTTRSSSKKLQSRSRVEKENETPETNEFDSPHKESFIKNDSSTETTGNKLTRELVALGIIANQKRTPKKNLDFEMFSSMTLKAETVEENSHNTQRVDRKEESIENISNILSENCSLREEREKLQEKLEYTSDMKYNRTNFMNTYEIGYKRPTASWIAKEKGKAKKEEESSQVKAFKREPNHVRRSKPVHIGEAHYMMPTISHVAKHVSKRSH
ncbi:hypothetical protein Gasu2_17760 [Galdieria sulphuraria]|uniref:Uncharacterized protein n=1 Tax=Galdieria sulphuraria TaxID=130081 RepID=M2VWR7_GALSU|nr:uncharacterized protein Gasu_48320 [Galdieria sulphuraria]EME27691.1 hypothetical protein Gasu_48320 [Galdieria sulphuraria]GJD07414.1 hypothetical protein Gasu2_17760 [Galdieria sulphuraria]|eukprot:XP_005704211.1 hypothetical protein Gasu_48320 [Galdieria sulphuraria]